ncbi:uncharacterized protein LOC111692011 [Anoplophora glabripennis]|uniref:uncharacterized protein LOC111692011 n=1 Tax=Anoplophora glabripennis TaxID=217634 RepID=UPI000C77322C|nr:uncharacterized protein LOC111692011 [Anoplophora glabripennis]
MSSSSTIVIKNPAPNFPDTALKSLNEQKSPALLVVSLWLFSSIFSAAKTDFSSNTTGISIAFNMQDVVLVAFSAWMLLRGLSTRSAALIFPWVIVTLYGLYFNHYKSLSKMMTVLRHVRHATALPWIALFVTAVGLVLRVLLTLRILQLSANLWYRKKLEKELYETIN